MKHLLLWIVALVITASCFAVLFLSDFADYVKVKSVSKINTSFTAAMLAEYDPYVFMKKYLAVADSNQFEIDLINVSHSPFFEIVMEGEYIIKYFNGNQMLAEDFTAGNDKNICNDSDVRKRVVKVPEAVLEVGYDKIILVPYSGSVFALSYFRELSFVENNVVLQKTTAHQKSAVSLNGMAGSPYDVQGLFAFLEDWNQDTINLQIHSATSELDIQLIHVENDKGVVMAEFPANTVLPRIDAATYDEINTSIKTYSLPLITATYEPYNVYLSYRYQYSGEIKTQKVNPFIQINEKIYNSTDIRTKDNMSSFENLTNSDGIVSFSDVYVVLEQPLFIPKGLKFVIKAGQTIDFRNNAFIISRSAIMVKGTLTDPVLFTSSDNSPYSGIAVLQAEQRSTCSYMTCDNLGELASGIYRLTGAVTFYESDVDFINCNFINNRSEDGLNIVRSDVSLYQCSFKNTYQDAFDSDFCTGTFIECSFETTGNDAIDVSTSVFTIIDSTFNNINDKAISAGEASKVIIENMFAQDVQIGIGAKDSSIVDVKNVTLKNAFIGFCAYQKKPEYGPCSILVNRYSLKGAIDFKYLIEEPDTLIVDGEQWFASQKKKQALIIEKLINEEPIR